jgi:hypothetical protein
MMLPEAARRRDVLNPRYRFRSAVTGEFVTRWFALRHPRECVRERAR